jgi:hypothetical protein
MAADAPVDVALLAIRLRPREKRALGATQQQQHIAPRSQSTWWLKALIVAV